MKQMTCAQMGGECQAVITGNTAEEMFHNRANHLIEAHPKIAEQMMMLNLEGRAKWMAEFQIKFDAAPEI